MGAFSNLPCAIHRLIMPSDICGPLLHVDTKRWGAYPPLLSVCSIVWVWPLQRHLHHHNWALATALTETSSTPVPDLKDTRVQCKQEDACVGLQWRGLTCLHLTCHARPTEKKVFLLEDQSLVHGRVGMANSGVSYLTFTLLLDFTGELLL